MNTNTSTQTPLPPEELAKLPRVYLVPAEAVAKFHDLAREAWAAAEGDSNDDEIQALQEVVWHMEQTFKSSMIVKARIK